MNLDVVVRQSAPDEYTAIVWAIPEVRATAPTEQAAIEQVRTQLTEWLKTARWVRMDVSAPGYLHPAAKYAGHSKDDPFFDEYLEEIARYRREVDEREQENTPPCPSDSSSIPTT